MVTSDEAIDWIHHWVNNKHAGSFSKVLDGRSAEIDPELALKLYSVLVLGVMAGDSRIVDMVPEVSEAYIDFIRLLMRAEGVLIEYPEMDDALKESISEALKC